VDGTPSQREAFKAVAAARVADIYAYFRRLGVEAAAAEDLTQNTLVAAWQNLPRLRDSAKMRSWIYGIAYRHYLRHREKERADNRIESAGRFVHQFSDDPGADQSLVLQAVRESVLALPDKYRHPVVLLYWQGLSYRETAKALSIPLGTLAWRMHRAFGLLRKSLVEKGVWDESFSQRCAHVS
jgi:RNA polymerase sigma-70 factor (ECF subfamily)